MAGHSKWHNIQARKSVQDAKKSKFFTRVTKELMLAAKAGGGDPANNVRLRMAIQAAKSVNLPKDKLEQAIKKGTGELSGGNLDEITYEGYGPGGVAVMIEAATDNRNRTVAEIRHILAKGGGSLGESGCVAWMFEKKGLINLPRDKYDEDQAMEAALEAGGEDVTDQDDSWEVSCPAEDFESVRQALEDAGVVVDSAEISMAPKTTVDVDVEAGRKLMRLMDALDDNEDVQKVYANFELPEELLAELG